MTGYQMTDAEAASAARITAQLNRFLQTEMPRYRYFESKDGWMFGWTVEKLWSPEDSYHGKYQSFVYMPKGKGARTGKAEEWVLRSVTTHSTRKAAKARALRLFQQRKAAVPA
jgi:hypothetical protein